MIDKWVLLNSEFLIEKEATISISDRGFLFGEGIFTSIRVQDGKCELWPRHLDRLFQQAGVLQIPLNLPSRDRIQELMERNQATKGIWRLKIIATNENVLVTFTPYLEQVSRHCTLALFPHPLESPSAHLKSLSCLDRLHVRSFAQQQGVDDAITQNGQGFLLETGSSNLFWIHQNKIWLPDPTLPYLKGVFLQSILKHLSLPIQHAKTTLEQLPKEASLYICNALTHVRPVLSIGHHPFPRNPHYEEILKQATESAVR